MLQQAKPRVKQSKPPNLNDVFVGAEQKRHEDSGLCQGAMKDNTTTKTKSEFRKDSERNEGCSVTK